ncbi:MAG: MATE family efflux transporter [Gemmatimonadetes bacterium]|nr:MATE family efflux transporter [Gemmatimonadota bacterium]
MHAPVTPRTILHLAWPIVLANAAVPLLGLVDTAVIGNTGNVSALGAIGLGALVFSFLFWGFGFLRMGTTGFTAQAAGRGDPAEVRATFARALMLAGVLGSGLVLLQVPLGRAALALLGAQPDVEALTEAYLRIRIWAAPASLGVFAVLGSLIGLGKTRQVLVTQVFLNGVNIALDVLFAGVFGWGVRGIALGTALAEWSTLVVGCGLLVRVFQAERTDSEPFWPRARILDRGAARAMMSANADIMIRTLFLLLGFGWFTNQGARFGNDILAANHVLMQLVTLSAYLLDGYAHATEILVGRAVGTARVDAFDRAVRLSTWMAALTAIVLATLVLLLGTPLVHVLTDLPDVRTVAVRHLPWTALYVALSFAAFQLDGVFIGATGTRAMRNASVLSCLVFLVLSLPLARWGGNTGLWLAFVTFVVARALTLWRRYPALRARVRVRG